MKGVVSIFMQGIRNAWDWFQLTILSSFIWRPVLILITGMVCGSLFVSFGLPILGSLLFSLPIYNPIEKIITPRTETTTNTLPLYEVSYWLAKGRVEHILITSENIIALGVLFDGHQLVVLNTETSEFFWKWAGNMGSLDMDQERVYVGRVSNVEAYNLRTGNNVWEYKQPSKGRGSLHVFVAGEKIKIYEPSLESNFMSSIYTLDARTGELLSTDNNPEPILPPNYGRIYKSATNTNTNYTIEPDGQIVATDIQTGQETGYLEMSNPSEFDKIAASDEFLVVYNDTNQELVVFRQKQ